MERNKKSNGINLELTNRFSSIYFDNQHLSMAQETNTPLETPHTSFNNIRTSSDIAATVQNKRPPICTKLINHEINHEQSSDVFFVYLKCESVGY